MRGLWRLACLAFMLVEPRTPLQIAAGKSGRLYIKTAVAIDPRETAHLLAHGYLDA